MPGWKSWLALPLTVLAMSAVVMTARVPATRNALPRGALL